MDTLLQDLRYALRTLGKSPGFATVAVLTLGLGIGATTAIFSAVDAVLLRPPPLADPERLVMVWQENVEDPTSKGPVAPATLYDWRQQVEAFRDVAGYGRTGVTTLVDEGGPQAVTAAWVTGNFFEVLGVSTAHGRLLREEETWADVTPPVVLSDRLWARRFGRDPGVIGATLEVGEVTHAVVGVVTPGAEFPEPGVDLWLPLGWSRAAVQARWFREDRFLRVIARLEEGASLQQAEAQLQLALERTREAYPETPPALRAGLTPLQDVLTSEARLPLLVLLGATALLLLLACANVANLLLVRASGRSAELALRTALGAGRSRIARQLLVESLVLALAGGTAGLAVGLLGIRVLRSLQAVAAVPLHEVPFDVRVLLFALAVTLTSGVLFGLLPALRGAAADAASALKEGGRTRAGGSRRRASELLIIAEVALAVLLVTGAGLLLRSFVALRQVDPGFRVDDRVAAMVVLPGRYDTDARILSFVDEMRARLERIHGVQAVTYASRLPLSGTSVGPTEVTVEGRGMPETGRPLGARAVAPNYFRVLGVPLLRGRAFEEADHGASERVVIINREAMRQLFPHEDPIGRRLTWEPSPHAGSAWYRIVGVVDGEHQHGVHLLPQAEVFRPFRQLPSAFVNFVLHTLGNSAATAAAVRTELAAVDPLLPLFEFRTLEELYATTLGRDRFLVLLIGTFAALALLLAMVGVYGVTAAAATQRTHEIGVRMAVGARALDVLGLVLGHTLALASVGIAAGLLLALAATQLLRSLLFEVSPTDPATFAATAVLLLGVALLASFLPARRSTRVDPMIVLRTE